MSKYNLNELKILSQKIESIIPFVNGIKDEEEYNELVSYMDVLTEDWDNNETLINIIFPCLELYEENQLRFISGE